MSELATETSELNIETRQFDSASGLARYLDKKGYHRVIPLKTL